MEFIAAHDLGEALEAKAQYPDAEFLAGGTDLMVDVNLAHHRPSGVISLRRVDELREIGPSRVGAGVTWAELERNEHRALAQASRTVGSPQIRSVGTIGGNIATASPAGDGLPWIAAMDASIVVCSRDRGERSIPWRDFFVGVKHTSIEPDEVILGLDLPAEVPETQEFAKIGTRNAMVISVVSCIVVRGEGGVRVALGSVAPTPIRAWRAEEMINAEGAVTEASLEEFARIVSDEVSPITDHRSTEGYRRHAAGVLARRLLQRCIG